MKSAVKKLISVTLAAVMLISMSAIGLTGVSAIINDNGTYYPSEGIKTNTYYFAMPGLWHNDYWAENENCAGVYWWTGADDAPNFPGYNADSVEGLDNLYVSQVPVDTHMVLFNNHIYGGIPGTDGFDWERFNAAHQTVDIQSDFNAPFDSEYYTKDFWRYIYDKTAEKVGITIEWNEDNTKLTDNEKKQIEEVTNAMEIKGIKPEFPEFGEYSSNFYIDSEYGLGLVHNFNNMVYVVNLDPNSFRFSTTIIPTGITIFSGSWFFYYGNGEYGTWPTKQLLSEKTGITFDGDIPVVPGNSDLIIDENGTVNRVVTNYDGVNVKLMVYGKITGSYAEPVPEIPEPTTPDDGKRYDPPESNPPQNELSSNSIYFYANPELWKGFKDITMYIYDHNTGETMINWGSKKGRLTNVGNGFWGFDFDAHGFDIEDGKQYGVYFTGDWGIQSCEIIFDKRVMGSVAYLTGQKVENPVDSNRQSYIVEWKNADPTKHAPPISITSLGNVIGEAMWADKNSNQIFYEFITSEGNGSLYSALFYNGKTAQQTIDDVANILGVNDFDYIRAAVDEACDNTGTEFEWNENISTIGFDQEAVELARQIEKIYYSSETAVIEKIQKLFDSSAVTKAEVIEVIKKTVSHESEKNKIIALLDNITEDPSCGDVNGDGAVNSADRIYLSRYLAKWDGYMKIEENAADVNGDNKIDSKDRIVLARHIAKWKGYETLPYAG